MRLLLASGGIRTQQRLAAWRDEWRSFLDQGARVLFIPYALADRDGYLQRVRATLAPLDLHIEGIHRAGDPVSAVRRADVVFVGGGNTFRLLATLYRERLLGPIRRRIRSGAASYVGVSAGTNVACPTIRTTNDMPIVEPPSLRALGLVPFQINPHYFDGPLHYRDGRRVIPYGGETRDDRLREFHEENATPVLGLREGAMLRIEGRRARLVGTAGGRLLLCGRKPRDLRPGADLPRMLRLPT
jgi:dipeptidase E